LAAAVKEIGRNVTGVQGDVSNLGDLDRLFAQIKREKGKLFGRFSTPDEVAKAVVIGSYSMIAPAGAVWVFDSRRQRQT
jgi:hypothetical protein